MARPIVLNKEVMKLLENAPKQNMRPAIGSLIQRKILDVGCYPFPFMVNDENIPLDGRTIIVNGESVKLEVRPVIPLCSRNAYSSFEGDTNFDNGKIEWSNGIGYLRSNVQGVNTRVPRFAFDSALGLTYSAYSLYNPIFLGMDNTAPAEWIGLRDSILTDGSGVSGVSFGIGLTLDIANNVLFKAWSGFTFDLIASDNGQSGDPGLTFGFFPMSYYIENGGTYSSFFDRYEYLCLDQIFNSDRFSVVGLDSTSFWEGYGLSLGTSGDIKGEKLLLEAVTGGDNAGSVYLFSYPQDFNYEMLIEGITAGQTLSGRQLAVNLFKLASSPQLIENKDPRGGFVETMAMLLGTQQKTVTLQDGTTASLRGIDFKNPCSSSWVFNEGTELGRWGYEVLKIPIGGDIFIPSEPPDIGCNVPSFSDYITGITGESHGVVHPLSWMLWKGISSGGAVNSYKIAYMHNFTGEMDEMGVPVYDRLEGIHDYLCYEYEDSNGLISRTYYPLRPITSQWYSANVSPKYNEVLTDADLAKTYGNTLNQKYDTGYPFSFRTKAGSIPDPISLRSLESSGNILIDYDGMASSLNGVTGVMFPYMIPIASFAMDGIGENGNGDLVLSGEFDNFSDWSKEKFEIAGEIEFQKLYPYYADGVTSTIDHTSSVFPYSVGFSEKPNFKLFSWNALSKIKPRNLLSTENPQKIVKSSFGISETSDLYGRAEYISPNTVKINGEAVDVDPQNYPPAALPTIETRGLTFVRLENGNPIISPMDCGSYVNVVRYANSFSPLESQQPGAFGITATKELIARLTLGADTKNLLEFDPDKIPDNGEQNFSRDGVLTPNTSGNFFDSGKNLLFTTPNDGQNLSVFDVPYYLTASEYFNKYVNNNTISTWWENVDLFNLALATDFIPDGNEGFAFDITQRLINPGAALWPSRTGFRDFYTVDDTEGGAGQFIGGVRQALNDGLHPGFVYRVFTTNAIQQLGSVVETECIQTWRSGGIPCHEIPLLWTNLRTNGGIYNSYFSGSTGCDFVGFEFSKEEFNDKKGNDFFGKCAVEVIQGQLGGMRFAYDDYFYSPLPTGGTNPYFLFQNTNCSGGGLINDPPLGATLTEFGLRFAQSIKIAEQKSTDLSDNRAVRDDLFAFTGNTASLDGSGNDIGNTLVSDWLQEKMSTIFEYFNLNRTTGTDDLAVVDSVLTDIYPTSFPQYKSSFGQAGTYSLWAIKPACVEEWTPECSSLATQLSSGISQRLTSFGSQNQMFDYNEFNQGVAASQSSSRRSLNEYSNELNTTINNGFVPQTMSDIVPQNEGFISSIRTLYIEPLGLATNVLATEAQAVPRATIASTVFGKLTTVIDSSGFIRDVNQITFESGLGMKILGDNTTGNLTFSITGLTVGSLEDVSIGSSGPQQGDILVYDGELAKWVNRPFADVVQPFLAGFTGFTGSF